MNLTKKQTEEVLSKFLTGHVSFPIFRAIQN